MGGLLVSTQINQRIGIAHQALPIILEQGFEGRDILKDDGRHDIAGAHGGLELAEVVRQRYIAELVHHQPDRDGQGTLVYLVGLVIEGLEGTGIEHPHQIVEGAVIVGDDGKHGLFALTHEAQLHIVPRRDTGDLGQDEGGEPHCGGYQDRLGGFAGGLLEDLILAHGNMVWILFLQSLKQHIQRGLEIIVILSGPAVLDHIHDHFKVLLLRGCLMKQIEDEGGVQGDLRL